MPRAVIQSIDGRGDKVWLNAEDDPQDNWGGWTHRLSYAKIMDDIEACVLIAQKIKEGGSQCPPVWQNANVIKVKVTVEVI